MAHHRQLIALRQLCVFLATDLVRDLIRTEIIARQTVSLAALLGKFEY